jgi:FixJ family two-component response regulator
MLCRPTPLTPELLDQLSDAAIEPRRSSQASQARVDQLLLGLDPRTQQVIRWVVLQDWSYRRTAAALNVSAMTVQRCLHSDWRTYGSDSKQPTGPVPLVLGAVRSRSICRSRVAIAAFTAASWRSNPSRQNVSIRSLRSW